MLRLGSTRIGLWGTVEVEPAKKGRDTGEPYVRSLAGPGKGKHYLRTEGGHKSMVAGRSDYLGKYTRGHYVGGLFGEAERWKGEAIRKEVKRLKKSKIKQGQRRESQERKK